MGRPSPGHAPPASRIPAGDRRPQLPSSVGRGSDELEYFRRPKDSEDRGERRSHSPTAGRQHEAPYGRIDRGPRGIVAIEEQGHQRSLTEVPAEPVRRADDPLHLVVLVGYRSLPGSGVYRVVQQPVGLGVELTESAALVPIGNQHEAPLLHVAPRRSPHRRIDHALDDVLRDRIGPHPAHGPGGVEGFVEIHGRRLRPRPGSPGSDRPSTTSADNLRPNSAGS